MFELQKSAIDEFYGIKVPRSTDKRGSFTKFFQHSKLPSFIRACEFQEEYFSFSSQGVIRGMHFQVPPDEHNKLVVLISGEAIDVGLDLRLRSRSFGKYDSFLLSTDGVSAVFVPKGVAHGFQALVDNTCMLYKVTSEYVADNDKGIRFDSFGFKWPIDKLKISRRDEEFPKLDEFETPF